MTAAEDIGAIRARLQALLDGSALSAAAAAAARELLDRIDAPARVVLFGLPGSGKSALLNVLANSVVVPEGFRVPTLHLRSGAPARTTITLPDGSTRNWPGLALRELAAHAPVFVQIEMPLQPLKTFSLMEIVADDAASDQLAAMAWAASRTDIAIWCSSSFGPAEADLWRQAPEILQDNAILALTKARDAATPGDFRRRIAIDAARRDNLDPEGANALRDEVRRLAGLGRQAYVDHALLFLSRYESRRAAAATRAAPAAPAPEPAPPAAPVQAAPAPQPLRKPSRPPRRTSRPDLPRQALDFLRQRAQHLSQALPDFGPAPGAGVLGHCLETMEQLIERVSAPEEMDLASADVEELVLETADVIMLLQSEPGEAPAADAVTLLLQLRRDLEARLVA